MNAISITKQQACRFLVEYHGLTGKQMFTGKEGINEYISRVGCIQFDPLNIVGHNHELVLQSRIRGFKPAMLNSLLYEDRRLIDGWDKNMSIYLASDWPYFNRLRVKAKLRYGNPDMPICKVLPRIRKELQDRGPLSSGELDYNETVNWSWAPTRISRAALESMYFWGELVIHHKSYTRRIYDFACNNLPEDILSAPDPNVTDEEYYAWYVLRRLSGIGMLWNKAGDAWLGIDGLKSFERSRAIEQLFENGRLIPVAIEGIKTPLYIESKNKPLLDKVAAIKKGMSNKRASIIAPLDNLLWDRRLVKELFEFDYRWEVYKPAAEREYGYYVLPVLYGERFVARFEPGWDNTTKTIVIKNWWWEQGIKHTDRMKDELGKCFKRFSGFLEAEKVQLSEKASRIEGLEWLTDSV